MRRGCSLLAGAVGYALIVWGSTGCGDDALEPPPPAAPLDERCGDAVGTCGSRWCNPPAQDAQHVEVCSTLSWNSNPPTSGPHYPIWAGFQIYGDPVPRGFYLHSMEHSAVVLAYNCDLVTAAGGDCASLAGQLAQYRTNRPKDPLCADVVHNRIIVTPDAALDVPFAAAAWGHMIKADCFDMAEVDDFVSQFYGMNYENFCTGGTDPTADFPADCGQ